MMRKNLFYIIIAAIILLFANSGASFADEALTPASAVEIALKNNPEISAARQKHMASQAKIPQVVTPEDPMLEYNYDEMRAGVMGYMGKPMRSYAVSQNMPFPTKLLLRGRIAARDAKIAYESLKEKERSVASRTKSAYLELWLAERSIGISEEALVLLEQFASSAAARYSVGKSSQQDALKAQVELAKVKNSTIILNQRREIARARLNILMNQDPRSKIVIEKDLKAQDIKSSLDELSAMASQKRPALRAFKYAVEKGRAAYALAWNEFLPDISAKYEQMIVDGSGDKWSGMIGVSVPIWFWEKQASGVREMRAELEMFKAEYREMENMALFEVKDAFARVESFGKLVELFETSFIPQAEQALKASLTGYEAGQIDFLNLLDSQRMLLDIKLDYYKMIVDREMAKAELEQAVGADL